MHTGIHCIHLRLLARVHLAHHARLLLHSWLHAHHAWLHTVLHTWLHAHPHAWLLLAHHSWLRLLTHTWLWTHTWLLLLLLLLRLGRSLLNDVVLAALDVLGTNQILHVCVEVLRLIKVVLAV